MLMRAEQMFNPEKKQGGKFGTVADVCPVGRDVLPHGMWLSVVRASCISREDRCLNVENQFKNYGAKQTCYEDLACKPPMRNA